MGAKVEGESHMPGYYVMRDLNVNTNGSWSPYYRENASGGQLSNGFMQNQTNGYPEYDREMLKRTMLEHEAVFRHQVYELHRVYKAQRDLMKDYQDKPICSYMMPADASQTNSFSSQIPPNKAKVAWQMQMAEIVPACGKTPVIELNNKDHSYKFLREGSVQSSPNGVPPSGVAQKSKRNTFDLQLPADCYVDNQDASENKPIDFIGVTSNPKPRNDAELTLQNGVDLKRLGGNNSLSELQTTNNQRGKQMADLNEPITGIYISGTCDSAYRGSVVPEHYHLENSWRNEVRSGTSYFGSRRDNSSDGHADEGTCSNFCDMNGKIRQEEKTIADKGKQASHKNFFAPKLYDTELQKAFKGAADERFTRSNQTICSDQNNSVGWFLLNPRKVTPIHNFPMFDLSDRSCLPPITAVSVPRADQLSSASPFGPCSIKPRSSTSNAPASRETDPRFASSTIDSYTSPGIMTQSLGTLGPKLKHVENLNGFYHGFPLDSFSTMHGHHKIANSCDLEQSNFPVFEHLPRQSSQNVQYCDGKSDKNKGFNLNQTPLDGPEDGSEVQDGRCTGSSEHSKGKGLVSGIPWLKRNAYRDDYMCLEKSRKAFVYSNVVVLDLEDDKDEKESTPPFHNLSVSASTSRGCMAQKDKINEDVADRIQDSGTFLAPLCHNNASLNKPAAEGVSKESAPLIRNLIDLNDEVPNEDNSESSVVSHECLTTSVRNGNSRRAFEIDLEAPPCEEDNKLDILPNVDDSFAAVSAAKDIIAMSMDTLLTPDKVDDHMLQWFADLATSNIGDPTKQAETQDCDANCFSDDGSDSFESLTLKLEETKIGEYWNRPQAPEAQIGEEMVSAALLLTKPRRGQQRRRRQKRDFQKDILPGLVSLSRHEVTEDFQLLEGLVRATGGSWEMGSGRRGRNGGRARGRKPRKNIEATVEEDTPASPPVKCDTTNLEADGVGMIGWGRTTRRCRRPRCPPGNNATAAS